MARYELQPQETLARKAQLHAISLLVRDVSGTETWAGIAMLVNEIAKNAIDHAGGKGFVDLRKEGGRLHVEVRDFGPGFDYEAVGGDGKSTLAGNGTNYGIGLGLIDDMAETLATDFKREHLPDGTRYTFAVDLKQAT